jgi:peptide/nickel transport system substrate-binding protein
MDLKKHSRRDFLRLTGLTAAGVVVAACAGTPEVAQQPTTAAPAAATAVPVAPAATATTATAAEPTALPEPVSTYNESPMLAERVAAGTLPPVDERLPVEPRVTPVLDAIGQYGGTITVGDLTMNLIGGDANQAGGDWGANWGRISRDLTKAEPNVLKEFSMNDDLTEFTGVMREGMKWSDGEPFTTADLVYWYEDMMLNTEITPLPHMDFRWGGEVMKLDVIDDYNFKLTFAQPHAHWLLVNVAHYYGFWGASATWVPSHYMKQFHMKYNADAGKLATAAGFDFWYQYHGRMNNTGQNMERPVLTPYLIVRDTPQMSFLERNPYYYGVDPKATSCPTSTRCRATAPRTSRSWTPRSWAGRMTLRPSRCASCSMPPTTKARRQPTRT